MPRQEASTMPLGTCHHRVELNPAHPTAAESIGVDWGGLAPPMRQQAGELSRKVIRVPLQSPGWVFERQERGVEFQPQDFLWS